MLAEGSRWEKQPAPRQCLLPLAGPLSIATTKEAETEAPPVQGYSRRCGKWQRKGFNRLIKETRCPRKCASKECDHPLAQKLPLELASSTQPGPSKLVGSAVTHRVVLSCRDPVRGSVVGEMWSGQQEASGIPLETG